MRRLSIGLGIALAAGCSIDTGVEPPPPPPWGAPISGGTMTVTRDGNRAVIADPDRARVVVLDLTTERVIDLVELAAGSEPGRVVEDGAGRFHVALRGSGELLTITGADRQLRQICGEPRGVAWQDTGDLVHVACATGELVSVPAGGGDPVRVVRLERDLRDVIVRETGLAVTTFRSANVLMLDAQGAIAARVQPPITQRLEGGGIPLATGDMIDAVPSVAWRTIAMPDGRLLMTHQRRLGAILKVVSGGYGGQCGGPVESALTVVGTDGAPFAVAPLVQGALPVDVAVDATGNQIAIASVGSQTLSLTTAFSLSTPDMGGCGPGARVQLLDDGIGAPTAVAFRPNGALLVYYPGVDTVVIRDAGPPRGVPLGAKPADDLGRALFHRQAPVGIACASCHPEARDDGGVWMFEELGVRRTQNLGGGILSRAPYHWGGDMPTIHTLLTDVFANRMGAGELQPDEDRALGAWLHGIPAPRGVVVDALAVARGEELFLASEQGCASCHSGALLTNNQLANVGTNGIVKVPSLIGVGARAPFLHDGCAATLRDRFGACGGGDLHGRTSHLTEAELVDLTAYLEAL